MKRRFFHLQLPVGADAVAAGELWEEDGKWLRIFRIGMGEMPPTDWIADEEVDLDGLLVLPGAVDSRVTFSDPGNTHREDFASGTRAAAAGGVTCVADSAAGSEPAVIDVQSLNRKLEAVAPKALVDFALWAGAGGPVDGGIIESMAAAGAVGVEADMVLDSDALPPLAKEEISYLLRACSRAGLPAAVHAEDSELVDQLSRDLQAQERDTLFDFAASRPQAAENRAVADLVEASRQTEASVHVLNLSSGNALDTIVEARNEGVAITAGTCPHFLEHTVEDFVRVGSALKTVPVVKSAKDRDRLWQGVVRGELSLLASDHAAAKWPEEKTTGSGWSDQPGIPGVELLLNYLYSEGVCLGRMTLQRLVELIAQAPAEFLGIGDRKGALKEGLDADFVVFDPQARWTVQGSELHNKNPYTPFQGQDWRGRVMETYVRGRRVFKRAASGGVDEFGEAGWGQFQRRTTVEEG